jgi:hypothetical protein
MSSRSSPSSASCPGPSSLLHYRAPRASSPREALRGLIEAAAAALLLSNRIRSWLVVEAYAELPRGYMGVVVEGCSVRGLAPQATAIEGVAAALLEKGRWPGVRLIYSPEGEPPPPPPDCVPWRRLLRGGGCPRCLLVDLSRPGEAKLKPRLLVAAVMVVHDERCVCGGQRRGEPG